MDENTESALAFKRNELLKKSKQHGVKFNNKDFNDKSSKSNQDIIDCHKRVIKFNAKGVLFFSQIRDIPIPNFLWCIILHTLGSAISGLMFFSDPSSFKSDIQNEDAIKVIAVILFFIVQISAIVYYNLATPDIKIFNRNKKIYLIKRANHILTKPFRKSKFHIADFDSIKCVELSSFKARRWITSWDGSDESRWKRQELVKYENYRLSLNTRTGDRFVIYDWHEMDHIVDVGEKISEYIGVEFTIL